MQNLHKLAEYAHTHYANEPGFIECVAYGTPPEGLRYSFNTQIDADKFQMKRSFELDGSFRLLLLE